MLFSKLKKKITGLCEFIGKKSIALKQLHQHIGKMTSLERKWQNQQLVNVLNLGMNNPTPPH